jgi:uncharacterized protein YegP (UPF0339 family)
MKFELYRDNKKQWRWRVTAENGRIIGASSEGYSKRAKAEQNAEDLSFTITSKLVADRVLKLVFTNESPSDYAVVPNEVIAKPAAKKRKQ